MTDKQLESPHTLISDYLDQYARQAPDREATVFGEQRLTYAELNNHVIRCAKALLARGIEKGDRVAVLCTSRTEYWITFLATTSIGAVWLGLNPKYQLQEIRYVLGDARPKILFAIASFEHRSYADMVQTLHADCAFIEHIVSITETLSDTQSWTDFIDLSVSIDDSDLKQRQAQVEAMNPALLVYTSGSTGKPKGALLSHYGLCFGSEVGQ